MIRLLTIAYRNFFRNSDRYRILMITAIVSVISIVLFVGVILGMVEGIYGKAARFYSGHLAIQGFIPGQKSTVVDPERFIKVSREYLPQSAVAVQRSIHYGSEAKLFFSGKSVNQRRFIGIDWGVEAEILAEMTFSAGSGSIAPGDTEAILISRSTADLLQAEIGDEVIMSLETYRSHINTGRFTIRGIFEEESFLGYVAYVDRQTLNEVMREPMERIHEIGFFFNDSGVSRRQARRLYDELATVDDFLPFFSTKEARDAALQERWEGRRYVLIPLDVQLSTLRDLISAMILVAVIIMLIFLGIIAIGITNTFSLLVMERIREIGTIRSLGMTKIRTILLFVTEAAFLGVTSAGFGYLTGVGALALISGHLDLSWLIYSELFLVNGELLWRIPIGWSALIILVVVAAAIGGALIPAIRAARINPVEALRE
jgi:putative ABC transport system permease protein